MPEAAVHEDHLAAGAEYEVRAPRQVSSVQAIPVAKSVNNTAHHHFNFGILPTDRLHDPAALFTAETDSL
jgi:hypothetical protein